MELPTKRSAGGIAKAAKIRAAYNANPNICKQCSSAILALGHQPLADVKAKQFCNRACAAQYNNRLAPKRISTSQSTASCQICGTSIQLKPRKGGGHTVRKYCNQCAKESRILTRFNVLCIEKRTKGEVFASRSSWQSARSTIRQHAALVYQQSGKPLACEVCGYSKHVEICHIDDVAKFTNDATIAQINDIHNLAALCPNHHWEFDNDGLELPSLKPAQ